jgi:hypothetical protein
MFHFAVRTRSVDVTISNILEGVVTYIPQVESLPSPSPLGMTTQDLKNIPSTSSGTHTLANTVQVKLLLYYIESVVLLITKWKSEM